MQTKTERAYIMSKAEWLRVDPGGKWTLVERLDDAIAAVIGTYQKGDRYRLSGILYACCHYILQPLEGAASRLRGQTEGCHRAAEIFEPLHSIAPPWLEISLVRIASGNRAPPNEITNMTLVLRMEHSGLYPKSSRQGESARWMVPQIILISSDLRSGSI
jgi:hypothetical protein